MTTEEKISETPEKTKVDILRDLIQQLADKRPVFFDTKGQGIGNLDTNSFMSQVRDEAIKAFGQDFAEQRICGDSNLCVDFYFVNEATIVEIALGIKKPNTEFEKDILKALLAQEFKPVTRLVLIGKTGAAKKCLQGGRNAMRAWALRQHKLTVDVYDIENIHLPSSI